MYMTNSDNFPCGICQKNIAGGQKAIFSNKCNFFVHIKCNIITTAEYKNSKKNPMLRLGFASSVAKTTRVPFGSLNVY